MRLTCSHCCFARLLPDEDTHREAQAHPVSTPNGPAAVDEVFSWMNRQITWQSLLADLEVLAWLSESDADS